MSYMNYPRPDMRAMSPVSFETQSLRALINGTGSSQFQQSQQSQPPPLGALDLSGFSRFHAPQTDYGGAQRSTLDPPPAKRPCGIIVPPLPTADPAATHSATQTTQTTQTTRPVSPPSPPNAVRAFPGVRHAGLLSEYGGVRRFMQMQKGERPWPAEQPT
jgi:hypothetical protein